MKVRTNFSNDKLIIYADPDKLVRVFENLINNAMKYGSEGKYIDVVTKKGDGIVKINTWFKNIIYLFLIIILFCSGATIISNLIYDAQSTYGVNFSFIKATYFIFFGGIGVILGLDNFINELRKEGKWRLDISRIIVLGLPCLIFFIPKLQFFLTPTLLRFIDSIYLVLSIILGYTLITSLIKEDEVIE